jgi:prepilin-type N-terminal cleavage/methylation domain-containing protein
MPVSVTKCSSRGLTLIEVLLATMILGLGITTLMAGMMSCLGVMKASREYADAEWVLGLGELRHPIRPTEDVEEDVAVEEDTLDEDLPESMRERGFVYERTVEEEADEDKDKLFIVRTRVSWGEGSGDQRQTEEVVRYVWEHK